MERGRTNVIELPELWNIDRLAEYLDCPKNFVYLITREHCIEFIRAGRELRFTPAAVARFLEDQTVKVDEVAQAVAAEPKHKGRRRRPDDVPVFVPGKTGRDLRA